MRGARVVRVKAMTGTGSATLACVRCGAPLQFPFGAMRWQEVAPEGWICAHHEGGDVG